MAAKFEFIEEYAASGLHLPERKTSGSAGYDFEVAKELTIPPMNWHLNNLTQYWPRKDALTLDEMAKLIKDTGASPTLIPTGVCCRLDEGTYLQLSVRSSCPLKSWLILANGVGVIDSDYYPRHIQFQVINLSPYPITLQKGDIIGQGIILPYGVTEDDAATGKRDGGFGSTNV